MDTFVDERDFDLIARDRYTFAVLDRILRGRCDQIRTNHESLIMCHSAHPYPVWIWTPDGCAEGVMREAWSWAAWLWPFSSGYRFNLKHDLADYFIKEARQRNLNVGVSMELFAYDCPDPIKPKAPVNGYLYSCVAEDIDTIADMIALFHAETGEAAPSRDQIRENARAYIENNAFYFWKDERGDAVACCGYRINQDLASLGPVYTRPEHRRRHYAQHLVYRVTEIVKSMGYMPMLYTDAGYPASNACYMAIGYQRRGGLCTIAAQ